MTSILPLCQGLPERTFAPGDVLLAEGKTSGLLYVLIDGAVEIVKGDIPINEVSDPGAFFGEISVLLGIPHMATVRALTTCRAYVVEDASAFLQSNTQISYELSRLLAQRLHGVTTYLVDLKRQYEDHSNHFMMIDDVLETLVHQQRQSFAPGSDRDADY